MPISKGISTDMHAHPVLSLHNYGNQQQLSYTRVLNWSDESTDQEARGGWIQDVWREGTEQ